MCGGLAGKHTWSPLYLSFSRFYRMLSSSSFSFLWGVSSRFFVLPYLSFGPFSRFLANISNYAYVSSYCFMFSSLSPSLISIFLLSFNNTYSFCLSISPSLLSLSLSLSASFSPHSLTLSLFLPIFFLQLSLSPSLPYFSTLSQFLYSC